MDGRERPHRIRAHRRRGPPVRGDKPPLGPSEYGEVRGIEPYRSDPCCDPFGAPRATKVDDIDIGRVRRIAGRPARKGESSVWGPPGASDPHRPIVGRDGTAV